MSSIKATFNMSKNAFNSAHSIRHLQDCKKLLFVDLSKNDPTGSGVIDILAGIDKLARSLNRNGNSVVSKVNSFTRK